MSQHNLPPVEKRHVLPRGEKESILLSSINLELALFFPFTISVCPQLFLSVPSFIFKTHFIQPVYPHPKWLWKNRVLAGLMLPPGLEFQDSLGNVQWHELSAFCFRCSKKCVLFPALWRFALVFPGCPVLPSNFVGLKVLILVNPDLLLGLPACHDAPSMVG